MVRRVERCIQFRNIWKILGYEDTQVPPHFRPLCYPKQQHFLHTLRHPFVNRVVQTRQLQTETGTTKNHVQCLMLSCYPNSFQIQKLTLSCIRFWLLTVPDTVHDSCGLRGEVGACRLPFSPDIGLEQIPEFAYMPQRATSTGRCPEM